MIAFSMDMDWAPEEIIDDALSIFNDFGIKCTLFNTHSSLVTKSAGDYFENAIHPNFNKILNGEEKGSFKIILDRLLDLYPESKGFKSHSHTQSSLILKHASDIGLLYETNTLLPYNTDIKPFKDWNNLIRIPYNWIDDVHWLMGKSFDNCGMNISKNGNFIFTFHPIHIYLNTNSKDHHERARKCNYDPKFLKKLICKNIPGTRDLLISLLKFISEKKIKTMHYSEISPNNEVINFDTKI